jgi:hypothetical protein
VLNPLIERVVQIDVRQQRRDHAPYTKGNFQFERIIVGWLERYALLDFRRTATKSLTAITGTMVKNGHLRTKCLSAVAAEPRP